MKCEACGGTGAVTVRRDPDFNVVVNAWLSAGGPLITFNRNLRVWELRKFCPACGGGGVAHCCEGERAAEGSCKDELQPGAGDHRQRAE